jgi:ribosome-associated toxin RatA of RatAB toxin-antitoxin module
MEAYPQFLNDLVSVKREGDRYHFVARAAILTIPATLVVSKTPDRQITFEMIEGPVEQLSGSWLIRAGEVPDQTEVALNVRAETGDRGEWLLRMTAKFLENKSDKLIAAFTERVIEVQHGGGLPGPGQTQAEPAGFWVWFDKLRTQIFGRSTSESEAPSRSHSSPEPPVAVGRAADRTHSQAFRDEQSLLTLEALATAMLPADEVDAGVADLGFASVAEMRSRYEPGRGELYVTALKAIDRMAQSRFGRPSFTDLTPSEQSSLLEAIRQDEDSDSDWGQAKPSAFFSALWEDTILLYCTHPDTWQRIGFPGPSFSSGGYQDYDQPQSFAGPEQ